MSDDYTPELNLFSRVGSLDALEEQASEARRAILGRPDDPARAAVEASYYRRRSELQEQLFKPRREQYERDQAAKQRREQYPLASALAVDLGLGDADEARLGRAEQALSELTAQVQRATIEADPELSSGCCRGWPTPHMARAWASAGDTR